MQKSSSRAPEMHSRGLQVAPRLCTRCLTMFLNVSERLGAIQSGLTVKNLPKLMKILQNPSKFIQIPPHPPKSSQIQDFARKLYFFKFSTSPAPVRAPGTPPSVSPASIMITKHFPCKKIMFWGRGTKISSPGLTGGPPAKIALGAVWGASF